MTMTEKPVILTGIRANEEPTLGNYLGAFVPMVKLQEKFAGDYQINMFVPDLHSFTTPINHTFLYDQTLHNLKYFLAAGLKLDDESTFLYRQSFIPAHSELTWILDCFTYVGEMQRMTQYKDKSASEDASVSMGLMNYPVLMAADILLYGAEWVPVGEDQFQHLEIARDIATRFNNLFGDIFTIPRSTKEQTAFINRETGLRIRNLVDPSKKMSKSATNDKSKINLSDSPEDARKKIVGATTDSLGAIHFDWDAQPGITSLLQIESLLSGRSQEEVNAQWSGNGKYGDFKAAVAETVAHFLSEFHERYETINDRDLLAKLESSELAMNERANATLLKAQQAVGLRAKDE